VDEFVSFLVAYIFDFLIVQPIHISFQYLSAYQLFKGSYSSQVDNLSFLSIVLKLFLPLVRA
jgi:hypothetical protein